MKFSIDQASHQGGREYNQDRLGYCYSQESLLMVLADGMGGHFHGELAAQIAVHLLIESFRRKATPTLESPREFLRAALQDAHHAVNDYTHAHALSDSPRTTAVACVIQEGHLYWAHTGDSRLYWFRNGTLAMRTHDHSRVQQLLDRGEITPDQAATHPERNRIYSCLGGAFRPEIALSEAQRIQNGDTLLLCSDGLWGVLESDEIGAILDTYPIAVALAELMDHAELRGGRSGDNLSAVALRWGDENLLFHASPGNVVSTSPETAITRLDRFRLSAPPGAPMNPADSARAAAEFETLIARYTQRE